MGAVASTLVIVAVVAALAASTHILLSFRRPTNAVAWLFAAWLFPIVGPVAYVLLGVYEGRRSIRRKRRHGVRLRRRDEPGRRDGDDVYAELPALGAVLERVAPFSLKRGNTVRFLDDASASRAEKLACIAAAERQIVLETYILEEGYVARELAEVLAGKAAAGVDVKLLMDPIGSIRSPEAVLGEMRSAGVRMSTFLAPNPFKRRFQLNFRNHRKILVVDGHTGFVGGRNWQDQEYPLEGGGAGWMDLDARVEGPAVLDLRRVALEDWCVATDDEIARLAPPPASDPPRGGADLARALPHGPDEPRDLLPLVLGAALRSARRSVRVLTPYFVPGLTFLQSLRVAALSGVEVELILPRHSDSAVSDWAARYYFASLLEAGVVIRVRNDPFLHAKALMVDDCWAMVGTSNFDQRSLYLNYEINLELPGEAIAARLAPVFDAHAEDSEVLDSARFLRRSRSRRLLENAAALFEPML